MRGALSVAVASALAMFTAPAPVAAQPATRDTATETDREHDATTLEDAAIAAWVSFRAVRARWGDAHETTQARGAEARAAAEALEAALRSGARVDTDAVLSHLELELADVGARLAELGTRCGGPAVEVLAAEARRDALVEAIARLRSDGPFVPG